MAQDTPHDAPLVDSHAHVYTTDMPLAPAAWHKPPADATIDQYVATLDKHGVKYAVLAAASLFDNYNEYSIEAARRHKRLRTTVIVKPTIDPYVMRMMKDARSRRTGAPLMGQRLAFPGVRGVDALRRCDRELPAMDTRSERAPHHRRRNSTEALFHRHMKRLTFTAVRAACIVVMSAVSLAPAAAQTYPVKPIRLIVPFSAGGPVDTMARALAPHLHASFKQSVVIDNRPGAAGLIGIESGIRASPDGYTITMVSSSYSASAATLKLPYHPVNDVAPIVLVNVSPQLAVVHPSVPIASASELIAYARANPGKLNYGSSGTGGSVHLSTEFFSMLAGTKMTHVPYKGQGPALNDLIGGQIQLLLGSPATIYIHVKANRLRAIAVTSGKRSNAMPEVPTFLETLPGYETYAWQAMLGPKALPRALVMRWNTEVNRILQLPEIRARMAADGTEPGGGAPDRFFDILQRDLAKWQKVVKHSGIKAGP